LFPLPPETTRPSQSRRPLSAATFATACSRPRRSPSSLAVPWTPTRVAVCPVRPPRRPPTPRPSRPCAPTPRAASRCPAAPSACSTLAHPSARRGPQERPWASQTSRARHSAPPRNYSNSSTCNNASSSTGSRPSQPCRSGSRGARPAGTEGTLSTWMSGSVSMQLAPLQTAHADVASWTRSAFASSFKVTKKGARTQR